MGCRAGSNSTASDIWRRDNVLTRLLITDISDQWQRLVGTPTTTQLTSSRRDDTGLVDRCYYASKEILTLIPYTF